MGPSSLSLARADGETLGYVERLLEANGLPAGDVRSSPGRFYVARRGDARVGIAGLEQYGEHGLVRSVVVEPGARGQGVGTALCAEIEAVATAAGVRTLYLLTTAAAGFFAGRGYETVDRESVPGPIRQTTEFADLCPERATCMTKAL